MLCVGRGYQHLFWETPYYALLWDEHFMMPLLEAFGSQWESFLNNAWYQTAVEVYNILAGTILIATALLMTVFRISRPVLITPPIIILTIFYFHYWYYHGLMWADLLELSAQVIVPFAAWRLLRDQVIVLRLIPWLKVAIALTFIGHGSYAIGIMPVPGHFIDMLISIFSIEEEVAMKILFVAGILDFAAAAAIFFPYIRLYALWYMAIWGFMTALARIGAHVEIDHIFVSLHRWAFEFLVRAPHFMIPLSLILWYRQKDNNEPTYHYSTSGRN